MRRNLLLISGLIGLFHAFVWVNTAAGETPGSAEEGALTVERIFGKPSLLRSLPSGIQWVGDGSGVSYIEKRGEGEEKEQVFLIREVPSGRERVVCKLDTVSIDPDPEEAGDGKFEIGAYGWDEDGELVVFVYGGDLYTMERKSGRIQRRTSTDGTERNPVFSPDGRRVAYTRDHDLFCLDLDGDVEIRLTATGNDTVLNGILDWVYMEELFTRGNKQSFYWSPDGTHIAFLEIGEGPVPRYPLIDYLETRPEPEMQRYPKAGDPNPVVRVGVVNAGGGEVVWAADTGGDSYVARLYWLGDSGGVAIEKLNRAQDTLTLMFADRETGEVGVVFEEMDPAWVNVNYLKHYYEKKRQFVWGSERSGHQHLYVYNADGTLARDLTWGDWEVTALNGVDEKKGRVYFTANKSNILERQLFVVPDKGGEIKQITGGAGIHTVTMSPDQKYFIDRFSSEKRPTVVSVYRADGKRLFEIADRETQELADAPRPLPEFITIESANGLEYHCAITKPADFDPAKKYPVLIYVYGGPHAQVVSRRWSSSGLWHSMMAQKGYIVFSLDNRGSFGRGKKWEDHILKNLGHFELEDQLAGVAYLRTLPYVDPDRIGIWGWSYGGYMTLVALFKAPEVFKAGVAVAPVTDWHLYDSIYTERYMKLPAENEDGYENASPINFVDGFQGDLLLMHGDADDNVHVQNSIQLIKELIDAEKDFDFMVYPQKKHGISGAESRVFLFNKMTKFFDEHLMAE